MNVNKSFMVYTGSSLTFKRFGRNCLTLVESLVESLAPLLGPSVMGNKKAKTFWLQKLVACSEIPFSKKLVS